jgi:two-component system, NtrC family, sensor kinase
MATLLRAERKALTDRLAELTRTTVELKSTQRQLIHGEKLASVGRLAAGVAHEIGNPLTAIAGLVELLRAGDLSPTQTREFLARIAGETDRIHGIIRDLLDFARQDSARDELQHTCDLGAAIEDAVSLVRPQKTAREVRIDVEVAPDLGEVVGARAKHTQVLLNLLMNAVDALSGAGHVTVRARHDDEQHVLLQVQDDGPGIPAEIAEHLFEPFCTTKPPGQGTGLGLAVTHAIVESFGGSIRVDSVDKLGQVGACFELRLPLARPNHTTRRSEAAALAERVPRPPL